MKMNLTASEWTVVVNALYTAAEKYRDCAKEVGQSGMNPEGRDRLVACFEKQAADCGKLLEKVE